MEKGGGASAWVYILIWPYQRSYTFCHSTSQVSIKEDRRIPICLLGVSLRNLDVFKNFLSRILFFSFLLASYIFLYGHAMDQNPICINDNGVVHTYIHTYIHTYMHTYMVSFSRNYRHLWGGGGLIEGV